MTKRHLAWAIVALLGIAVTAAITWSITRLAGQHIGLASEPLSVIRGLAPSSAERAAASEGPAGARPHGTRFEHAPASGVITLPSAYATAPQSPSSSPSATQLQPQSPTQLQPPSPAAGPAAPAGRGNGGDDGPRQGGSGSQPDD